MAAEKLPQSAGAAAVAPGDGAVLAIGLLNSAAHHFVRNRVGEQHHQIGAADLFFKIGGHFGKHLGFIAELFADLPVLTFHPLIAANNYNAHGNLLKT